MPYSMELRFGDRFVPDCVRHPPVVSNRQSRRRIVEILRFCGCFRRSLTGPSVSADNGRLLSGFLAIGLCRQNFRSPAEGGRVAKWLTLDGAQVRKPRPSGWSARVQLLDWGLRPRASNCWLRWRIAETLDANARGRRPSTAARRHSVALIGWSIGR